MEDKTFERFFDPDTGDHFDMPIGVNEAPVYEKPRAAATPKFQDVNVIKAPANAQPLVIGATFSVCGAVYQVYNIKTDGRIWARFIGFVEGS